MNGEINQLAAINVVRIPRAAMAELLNGPCGPALQNFLVVLSSADASVTRDGRMFKMPFDDLMSAAVACNLEVAARNYFAMGQRAGKRSSAAEFIAAATATALRVADEFTGIVQPGGG